jgi:Zn-dependent M16 (insulinase) family peptidase
MNNDLKAVQRRTTHRTAVRLSRCSPLRHFREPEELPIKISEVDGRKVLTHDVDTDGILYADLYFSAAGLNPEELAAASFLCSVLTEVDTEHYDTLELQNQIKAGLGKLSFNPEIYEKDRKPNTCAPYIVLSGSVLSSKRDELIRLAEEVVNHSLFTDKKQIRNLLRQEKIQAEQDLVMSGHRYAMKRVEAYTTAEGAAGEYTGGLFSYRWIKETESPTRAAPRRSPASSRALPAASLRATA